MRKRPYSVGEAAEKLGLSIVYVKKLCKNGAIKANKFNRSWMIMPEHFDEYAKYRSKILRKAGKTHRLNEPRPATLPESNAGGEIGHQTNGAR